MNVKTQKGITLIALIITIIVLMILAVVAINSVKETGIINYAQNAVDEYSAGQTKENEAIAGYLEYLDKYDPTKKDKDDDDEIDDEPVSIAGTYGYDVGTSDDEYFKFNEGTMKDGIEEGTGLYVEWNGSPTREIRKTFTYKVLSDKSVILIMDGYTEEATFKFEAKKDSNGNVINRVLYSEEYSGPYDASDSPYNGTNVTVRLKALTTDGIAGLPKINSKTYTAVDSGDIREASFENGEMILKCYDEDTNEERTISTSKYFVVDMPNSEGEQRKIVYAIEFGMDDEIPTDYNMYSPYFIIWNENHIEWCAGS